MSKEIVVEIRPERPEDYAAIHEVNLAAFGEEGESLLIEKIRQSEDFIPGLSLVAVYDGQVVGHILFSLIRVAVPGRPDREQAILSLAPMAVLPEFQGRGIGSAMVRRGLEIARELGHKAVVVVGHPDYYPRFGFSPARAKGLEAPFPVPDEAFMALELEPDGLEGLTGMLVYPSAFDELN
jgi:putative acetyltransferase